jgi:adenine-specific DNA-methyltransferase
MRYFGSKVSTLDALYTLISERVPGGTFCDPFGGIGCVGSFFKGKGYEVWSGDVLLFPYFFQIAKLKTLDSFLEVLLKKLGLKDSDDLCDYLTRLRGKDGWFVREYSTKRSFFTRNNALKIQECRLLFRRWTESEWITIDEQAVLFASLINSMDKVANTAGTYYAYLKGWDRKALLGYKFELINPVDSKTEAFCFNESAESLVKRQQFDVVYLDPPYNQRSYSHYYHLPETIASGKTPRVHGMSGIPNNTVRSSKFNSNKEAKEALDLIIASSRFRLLVFHYADDGIITAPEIMTILSKYGHVEEFHVDSKGYSTKMKQQIKHHLYMVQNV